MLGSIIPSSIVSEEEDDDDIVAAYIEMGRRGKRCSKLTVVRMYLIRVVF